MGRSLLLTVILITLIFAGIAITLLQRTTSLPEMVSRNLDEIILRNTGSYALKFAIKQLQTDPTMQSSITQYPNYYSLSYNNFILDHGRIDSLKFAYYNAENDSIEILAIVSTLVNGTRKYHTSEARIGVSIETHTNQVGGWHLDESSGGDASEFVNGEYTGTLQNFSDPSSAWTAGVWGNGLNFDGNDDYVALPPEVVNSYADKFTAASWAKLDQSFRDWGTIISEQKNNENKTIVWAVRANLIDITLFGLILYSEVTYSFVLNTIGQPSIESVSITRNENQIDIYDWHFILVTYDGTLSGNSARIELQIVDENLSSSKIISKILQYHVGNNIPNEVTIGGKQTNRPWGAFIDQFNCIDGTIDEVNLFDKILTAEEIQGLYLDNGFIENKVIYWRQ